MDIPLNKLLEIVHWEYVASDVPAIRPRAEALPVASVDQVLLGVPHMESAGTVRLPPPHMVAYGYRYGANDQLMGVMVAGGSQEPIRANQYRVKRTARVPGTGQRLLEIVKVAEVI